jgi:hypothetical protein
VDGFAGHLHNLFYLADLKGYVYRQCRVHIEHQSRSPKGFEAGLLYFYRVMPQRQGLKRVKTCGIRGLSLGDASICVGGRHRGTRDRRASGIFHRAGDAGCHCESIATRHEKPERGQRESDHFRERRYR